MTPLEIVRALVESGEDGEEPLTRQLWSDGWYRVFCESESGESHPPDCPWLALPRVAAALEAAQDAIDIWEQSLDEPMPFTVMDRLRRALRGEG